MYVYSQYNLSICILAVPIPIAISIPSFPFSHLLLVECLNGLLVLPPLGQYLLSEVIHGPVSLPDGGLSHIYRLGYVRTTLLVCG